MRNIDLRHLRYFLAVAEQLHFGRAAKQLGLAQPPLSQQIQQLERAVGEPLFTRRPTVRLTEAGAAFLSYARESLEQISRGVDAARRAAAGATGQLTVGFAASALLSPLTQGFRSYRRAVPGVELVLRELSTADQITQLQQGRIDVGFLRMPPSSTSGLILEQMYEEPFVAILPRSHALSHRSELALQELKGASFILFPREVAPTLYDQVQALFHQAGFRPEIVVQAREWLTIVGLVEAEIGVSIVPYSFRRLGWGEVSYATLPDSSEQTGTYLGRAAGAPSATLATFAEVMRSAFRPSQGL